MSVIRKVLLVEDVDDLVGSTADDATSVASSVLKSSSIVSLLLLEVVVTLVDRSRVVVTAPVKVA